MNLALASLLALLVAIVVSMLSRLNIGVLAIALAWLVGVVLGGMKPDAVMAGFPTTLFLTLTGVTLLFACAEVNGTLRWLAERAVAWLRGERRWLPLLFFCLACLLSSVGPGAISAVALIIPLAMPIGLRAGLPPFLTALMVANGANAGNLSPLSSVGIIANNKIAEAGLGQHAFKVWLANFAAHLLVSVIAYVWLMRGLAAPASANRAVIAERGETMAADATLMRTQWWTLIVLGGWILAVLIGKWNPALSAFAAVVLLVLLRATEEGAALKKVPWDVIVMVCGVSLLLALLEKTGGLEYFTALLTRISTPLTINGVIAFVTGLISTYSSTSGVVLPAFLPLAAKLPPQLGGGDSLAIALSINVGSALVDVSPLSTLGALCVATLSDPAAAQHLFRRLFVWGLAMSLVAALLCQLCANWLARW